MTFRAAILLAMDESKEAGGPMGAPRKVASSG